MSQRARRPIRSSRVARLRRGVVAPVRTRQDFAALSTARARGRSGPVWISHVPRPASGERVDDVRVAYAVGRKAGSAVVRNRIRRRLRVVMRELDDQGVLAPGLYLVGARSAVADLEFATLRAHVRRALPSGAVS